MQIFAFLTLIVVAGAQVTHNDCNGVIIDSQYHEEEILKGLRIPFQLALDYDTNTLFFSYYSEGNGRTSAYINFKTNKFGTIGNINGGFANAVDRKNHVVYLGGNDGIYTFDFDTKSATLFGAKGIDIWQLLFEHRLYYVKYPAMTVFYYENAESKVVPELEGLHSTMIAIDNNENFYSCNDSHLFLVKKDTGETKLVGLYAVNAFTFDINKNLHFSTADGIYSIDNSAKVKRLVSINVKVYGMAVETDGSIIYAEENRIVRLRPLSSTCTSASEKD